MGDSQGRWGPQEIPTSCLPWFCLGTLFGKHPAKRALEDGVTLQDAPPSCGELGSFAKSWGMLDQLQACLMWGSCHSPRTLPWEPCWGSVADCLLSHQSYVSPLRSLLGPADMAAIFINLEVSPACWRPLPISLGAALLGISYGGTLAPTAPVCLAGPLGQPGWTQCQFILSPQFLGFEDPAPALYSLVF